MAWILAVAGLSPALADWVSIAGIPGSVHQMGLERTDSEEWVPLAGQTLWPSKGYNPEVIGNLANAGQVPDNFAARNFAMVAPVSAGTPPQDFSLLLDIEGSDIWLPSIRCDTCAADKQEQENFYHATESKSFHPHLASTPFGLAPRAVSVNEGGGHVGGYVINDTLSIGSLQIRDQPFLLAEEGDLTARRERAWDGVMGLGRKRPLTGGPSLHQSLVAQGRPATYILAPQTGRYLEEKAGRLALGVAPERLEYIGPFTWVDVLNSAGSAKGGWSFLATGKVNDLPPRPVMAMIETGTSYLLVPAKEYLSIVRSLVPTFDQHCGYDEEVGNIVVCDCEAKNSVTGEVVLQINARDGEEYKLQLNSRNLLQEAPAKRDHKHWMANNEEVCVLQIQQLPANDRDSAYGILGHPFADRGRSPFGFLHPGPFPGSMMGPLLIPLGAGPNGPLSPLMRPGMPPPPPGGMPGLPISKGELKKAAEEASEIGEVVQGMAEAVEKAKEKNERGGGLMKELLDSLAHMPGTGKVMKEEVTQMMPNGDRCTTELVRAANGTVLHERTWLVDDDGNKQREATPGQCPKHKQRRLEEQPRQLAQDDFWVLGDVFLRRHVVAFDFAGNRLGFAVEEATPEELAAREEDMAQATAQGGGIEALEGEDGLEQFNEDGRSPQGWQPRSQAPQGQGHAPAVVYDEEYGSEPSIGIKTVLVATALVMGAGAFCGLFGGARGGLEETRQPAFTEHFHDVEEDAAGDDRQLEAA
eukprot:CAMPEP_0181509690 /NCGR_PEP_ID=MMETSP1110-20121109/60479_1 /TAXON_ID=174948 /ORGANISM="Symbiodinium sp., Strain CCMP421" /LENGTH=753 /DNA_ID=CAMNT_0023639265 /DNA_START=25 /DNA_END=2282 /DNA_ORIENTATION=+